MTTSSQAQLQRRWMADAQAEDDTTAETTAAFEYDLSSFSLRFEKCQYVKAFDDDLAESDKFDTVLATKQFVVFQLCPSDQCNDQCSKKGVVHGEYVVDIDDYLAATIANRQAAFETMCDNCNEFCNNNGEYCSGCGKTCFEWESMASNGYVDASQYSTCTKTDYVRASNDDQNGEQNQQNQRVYVGPMCTNNGQAIVIGVFADQYCWEPISDLNVEDVLGYKLSYYILDQVVAPTDGATSSSTSNACLSCMEDANSGNANDQADGDNVNEMCEDVYNAAAKCESIYGLETGFINMHRNEKAYENQVENEFMSCTFIKNLIWNSYTEEGEINYMAVQDEVIRTVTTVQATALTCLSLFFVCMLGYGLYLHNAIQREYPDIDLASQGDGVYS
ncbi:hypothetical protein MHU86_15857 [Fragilaria crotonensis]|nr:hypothetical protein MHU86_25657 [Fragilaria crotonensis]KAI2498623.1 hypothetical protein MHU86_15857 [Fragilaria crotonensis]